MMKKYKVTILGNKYEFALETGNIAEALEAVIDAATTFDFNIDKEDVMETLVTMKTGNKISTKTGRYKIEVVKAEAGA